MTQDARPRISIALATYNGARFLGTQLESFLAQTLPPDELVVGDDDSADETIALIEAFAARAPFPVHLIVNRPGLGPADNFAATISRCAGDVVFLSDQDDIWHADKLQRMMAFRAAHPAFLVTVHDAALVDGDGSSLGRTMGQQIAAAGADPARGLVAGCCMAIDGRLGRFYRPAPATRTHDAWLTSIADLLGARGYLAEPLIDYRRHGGNVSQSYMSGERRANRWGRLRERVARAAAEPAGTALAAAIAGRRSALAALEANHQWLAEALSPARVDAAIAQLRGDQARDERRLAIHDAPRSRRPGSLLRALAAGTYRGGNGALSLVRDIVDAARNR